MEEIIDKLNKEGLLKKVWFPKTKKEKNHIIKSKFSGIPYLLYGEKWPICPICTTPFQLIIQLNSADLPEEKKFSCNTIIQLFICKSGCSMSEYIHDYKHIYLLRKIDYSESIIHIKDKGATDLNRNNWQKLDNSNVFFNSNITKNLEKSFNNEQYKLNNFEVKSEEEFIQTYSCFFDISQEKLINWFNSLPSEKTIKQWDLSYEFPLDFDYYEHKEKLGFSFDERDILKKLQNKYEIKSSDKLGGFGYWLQTGDWQYCSKCKKEVEVEIFFQIGSEDENIPYENYIFGDGGILYLYNCLIHKNEIEYKVENG